MTLTNDPSTHAPPGAPGDRPADVRDMAIVHGYYRREFEWAPRILRDLRPADHQRRNAAQGWFTGTLVAMRHHHLAEDELMYPLMQGAAPPDLIAAMEAQHRAVAGAIDTVDARLRAWVSGGEPQREALARAYDDLLPILVAHLEDEEERIVPLIAECLTAEQYSRKARSGNDLYEPHFLMMCFGGMIEDCSEADADFMLSHLPEAVAASWNDHIAEEYVELMALLRGSLTPTNRGDTMISRQTLSRPGQFVLRTADPDVAGAFYRDLFGWKEGADGGLELQDGTVGRMAQGSGGWVPYLVADDLDAALAMASEAGARAVGAAAQDQAGRSALLTDPSGAELGLWQPASGTAVDLTGLAASVVWMEEKTHDQAAAVAFHQRLFGFEVFGAEGPGKVRVLKGEGAPFGGVMQMDERWSPDHPPHWLLYFAVGDLSSCMERAVDLGGSVWFQPTDTPLGLLSYIRDPLGDAFAVVEVSEQGWGMVGGAPS